MGQKDHWERVYSSSPIENLGWYEPHLQTSLSWIKELRLPADAPIIDVGGGGSTLVDDLLESGYRSITVLDISEKALSAAKARLAEKGELVTWLDADICAVDLPRHYFELWHDRAVFHFLTLPEQQRRYLDNLLKALTPAGHLIIATFAPQAPPQCSGLPVHRYSSEMLESTLGREFELVRRREELHVTPGGVEQMYLYCHFRRTA